LSTPSRRKTRPAPPPAPPGGPEPSQSELRNEAARAALEPLAPGERPLGLRVAIIVAAALALGNAIAYFAGATIGGRHPGGGVLTFTAVLGALAVGMALTRYWAVILFEALLTLIILLFSLFLVEADSVGGLALCLGVLVPSGWLFWKLIRVMGRIQVTRHQPAPPA
jgi:hypothetical protein